MKDVAFGGEEDEFPIGDEVGTKAAWLLKGLAAPLRGNLALCTGTNPAILRAEPNEGSNSGKWKCIWKELSKPWWRN